MSCDNKFDFSVNVSSLFIRRMSGYYVPQSTMYYNDQRISPNLPLGTPKLVELDQTEILGNEVHSLELSAEE